MELIAMEAGSPDECGAAVVGELLALEWTSQPK
jgi:hypothetical protein